MRCRLTLLLVVFATVLSSTGAAGTADLWSAGYAVIPAPRHVRLAGGDVVLDDSWTVRPSGIDPRDISVRALGRDLETFHGLRLAGDGARAIRLSTRPGTVAAGADREIERQAYRLRIDESGIEIIGNDRPGLFYGVQTLLQLVKRDAAGRLVVPKLTIEDWPTLQLRFLHWDHQQHQDHAATLKRYLDWAARFKANMIAFQLEDKFEFPSHPVIGAPGAFTTSELQDIVDYGLERHIQVVPLIQAPAHFSWALKHPEFKEIRADGNNYQACLCDPRSYDLIFSLYDDVMRASRGIDYLFVSTDEVYYAGICAKCSRPYNNVNRSLQWVDFVSKAHDFLTPRGRRMLIWAEYPLLAEHVKMLPPDIIDGVIGEPAFLKPENEIGMRQLAYTSMQAVETLFPDHLSQDGIKGHLEDAYQTLRSGKHLQGRPIGAFGAAWDASGLHNETFWLGWSAVAQWAWHPGRVSVEDHAAQFMNVYYGPHAEGMTGIYRLMQRQARSWERTWDRVPSRVRGPAYGNSFGKGIGTQRTDMTLSQPALPRLPDLAAPVSFRSRYAAFLSEAHRRTDESDRLISALEEMLRRVDRNRYNVEVMLSLARFIRHHWTLLIGMADAEDRVAEAHRLAADGKTSGAVAALQGAADKVDEINRDLARSFEQLRAVFEKSQYPRGRTVNGRTFVDINDDTKDYWAQRRTDLTFMTAPEESIGLAQWRQDLARVAAEFASAPPESRRASPALIGFQSVAEEATRSRIDSVFAPLAGGKSPGIAILVRKGGRTVFQKGYGVRDERTLARIDAATDFRLASVSKQFAAMATMLLVHDGSLRYDERLTDIFPDFPAYGRAVTLRHLLTHTAGLPDYEDLMKAAEAGRGPIWTSVRQIHDEEVLGLLKGMNPKFAPGTSWAYSNSAYVLLGLIVAKASGKPFERFLQERIFAPLRMSGTVAFVQGKNTVPNRAFGHTKTGDRFVETDQSPTSATLGDGGIYSNLVDLAKWDSALQNHSLLSEAEMKAALAPVKLDDGCETRWPSTPGDDNLNPGKPVSYGFGWFLDPYKGRERMWHYGDTLGFRTAIDRFPREELTVVVLCNRTDLDAGALALRAADILLPH